MATRTKQIAAGSYRTLETFWSVSATGWFRAPAGASIRIIWGYGWLSWTSQSQKLDGVNIKKLSISKYKAAAGARMQIKVAEASLVTYEVVTGDVILTPEISF